MKKVIALALCVVAVLLVGCSGGDKTETSSKKPVKSSSKVAQIEHPVDSAWFDDAVFVGDSVTLKLSYYCDENPDALGKAQFFCAGSLGYTNALWDIDREDAVHPYYKGSVQLTENCAKLTGASKVFVMLGMNDIALYGIEDTLKSADELIGRIRKNSPKAAIYVESVTPILAGCEVGDLNNENVNEFDSELRTYCEQNKLKYLDVHSVVVDEDGYLNPDYCGDPEAQGIHFTSAGCEKWIEYLKNNV